jgi:adenine-specific DNA-methyltransferase
MTDSVKPEPADLEKMNGTSLDIAEQRRCELKQLLPGVFTETTGQDGQPVETIDFERLKAELGTFSDVYEGRRERYGMEWPGKRDCMKLIQEPSRATLKPCREESVDFDTTQNLFIEGDNLEVLKLLQKSYYGKVKMIYIDPPYNTGKEFIYPDKYSESLETYLAYAGLVDDEGRKFSTNTPTEGRFHTKWLNMMYPRLYLARNLLRENGVVFISIDENEIEGLRRICDEIFGEENYFSTISWKNVYGGGAKVKHVVNVNEYVLFYAKNKSEIENIELPPDPEARKRYTEKDEKIDNRGPYYTQPLAANSMDSRPNLRFPILHDGEEIWPEKQWQWSKERVANAQNNNELVIKKSADGKWSVRYKQYLKDENGVERGAKLFSILNGPWSQEGTAEIKELFGNGKVFTFPKPSSLIKHLISAFWQDKEAIILDFFAGSCPTASAVMSLNKEYGGERKYIMVQLPEPCEEESAASEAGFKTISDIGKERIRRAALQIQEVREGRLDLDNDEKLDLGYKVLTLDKSNFKQWQTPSEDLGADQLSQQLALHTDHIDPDASQEDILYELLIKAGFMPTEKIEALDLAGKQVFSIAEGALLICLEEELTSELIDAVADREPMQFICLDKGFKGNDQLKANAVQTFKSRSQGAETEMVFKVV